MIYCQRCKKANPTEADHCEACGAYLLVISHTPDSMIGGLLDNSLEEHLLERISALESALTRANERFEQLLEIAQQQATGSFYDHVMIESLTEMITEHGLIDSEDLEERWRNRLARHYQETAERERLEERCDRVISSYRGNQRERFTSLVEKGARLIGEGRSRRGLRSLEDALLLDDRNVELRFILGEAYFILGRNPEAADFLRTTLDQRHDHFEACLLLALLSGEQGHGEVAKDHFARALAIDANSFAAHYGLGRLLASEGKLSEALTHLRRALSLRPSPEMHYLVGRAYFELGRFEPATRHLQKAVRLDPRFDVAQYSLGYLFWRSGRPEDARRHIEAALASNPAVRPYHVALRTTPGDPLPPPPAPGWASLFSRRKSDVDESRFHNLLRRDLNLSSFTPEPGRRRG